MVNQLKVGVRVLSIHHNDGKAHPKQYWLELEGIVSRVKNEPNMQLVDWDKNVQFASGEKRALAPSRDGFCYYMAELQDMDKYKDGEYYKVPTDILLAHMKTYKSPWEGM